MRAVRCGTLSVLAALCLSAQGWVFNGRVVMNGGGPPPKPVVVERICGIGRTAVAARTARDGSYKLIVTEFDPFSSFPAAGRRAGLSMSQCFLRASLPGYESNRIDLDTYRPTGEPILPDLTLRPRSPADARIPESSGRAPRASQKAWERAGRAVSEKNWAEAELRLREVVKAAPKFAPAWSLLGLVCQNLNRIAEARASYREAIAADPRALGPYYLVLQLDFSAGEWRAVQASAAALIAADRNHQYPEAHLYAAIARYNLGELPAAESSARETIRFDAKSQFPRAEYVLAAALEARGDIAGALEHYRRYLEREPNAPDAPALRSRVEKLSSGQTVEPQAALAAANLTLANEGEVWIPGGIRALGAISHAEPSSFTPERFFEGYCRALVRYNTPNAGSGIPGYLDSLRAYFAAVAELSRIGNHGRTRTLVTLSLSPERRAATERALALLGWKVRDVGGSLRVELSDAPEDGPRQTVPAALGIDEIAMQQALESGAPHQLEIVSEQARLAGGDAWLAMIQNTSPVSGGLAEAFAIDSRLAKVYAGLSGVSAETSEALAAALGAHGIAAPYPDLLYRHAASFRVENGSVMVPGGEVAEPVWETLAGASPRHPREFLRGILDKDRGTTAAFYAALAQAGRPRQRLLLLNDNPARAYRWFTEVGVSRTVALIENIPVTAAGSLRVPGGAPAWGDSTLTSGGLPSATTAERLVTIARIEDTRGAPFDEACVRLLVRHYDAWAPLFPYFQKLPALGSAEFEALAAFTSATSRLPLAQKELVLGAWYSAVEFASLGSAAGSVDAARAAEVFRLSCQITPAQDLAPKLLAILRALTGSSEEFAEALRSRILALNSERRAQFDRVLTLQRAPSLDEALRAHEPQSIVRALTGLVYANSFPADGLLISEDPELVNKHRFATSEDAPLFRPSELIASSAKGGSHLTGGFANLAAVARGLAEGGAESSGPAASSGRLDIPDPGTPFAATAPAGRVFRADARLVMVYTTVTEGGRYVDDLTGDRFQIVEDGQSRPVAGFEPYSSGVSCAVLLDTTGSMHLALPTLKSAALQFIHDLRPIDSVAVYSFSDSVSVLQPFTTDKAAAKRAVLRTYASGNTALYDAIFRITRELSGRGGKKVIVVFTDGEDNASTIAANLALRRAKSAGTPVYTIAQGQALDSHALLKELSELSSATGGLPFGVRKASEVAAVFERVAQDLSHGYLLSFQPQAQTGGDWHRIEVTVKGPKRYKVRARDGYYSE
jgi:Ca-activated chloride channel family protein